MNPIDKFTQLAMAVGRLADGVAGWSYKPHTDNDGIRGFRYESRGKAVAFVTTDYVRVGLADGMVLFDMDITSDDFRFALANAARSADSLSATLLEIENRLSSL